MANPTPMEDVEKQLSELSINKSKLSCFIQWNQGNLDAQASIKATIEGTIHLLKMYRRSVNAAGTQLFQNDKTLLVWYIGMQSEEELVSYTKKFVFDGQREVLIYVQACFIPNSENFSYETYNRIHLRRYTATK